MRFGKHKGVRVSEIPVDYLLWLLDNATDKLIISEQVEIQRIIPTNKLVKYFSKPKSNVISRRSILKRRSRLKKRA